MPQLSQFSHECTDAYPVAVAFHSLAVEIASMPGSHFLRNPLERAAVRIVVALAEAPECSLDSKSRRFHDAATSAARKCAALLLLLSQQKSVEPDLYTRARELLLKLNELIVLRFAGEERVERRGRTSRLTSLGGTAGPTAKPKARVSAAGATSAAEPTDGPRSDSEPVLAAMPRSSTEGDDDLT